jgi:tetratricopeptide (TPR) repeat protein
LWLHQPDAALETFKEVRLILKDSPESTAYIDSLNGSAAVSTDASKCDEAEAFISDARRLSGSNYIAGNAEALLLLSDCQNYHNPPEAISTARQSLELWGSINDRLGMARAYEAIGHYEYAQTNLVEATKNHEESLKIFRELNVVSEQAEALINLAFVAYRQGEWDEHRRCSMNEPSLTKWGKSSPPLARLSLKIIYRKRRLKRSNKPPNIFVRRRILAPLVS